MESSEPEPAPPALSFADRFGRGKPFFPVGGAIGVRWSGEAREIVSLGTPFPRADVPPEKVIFEIGSVTKIFTGLLLAFAATEERLDLDDSIARHLPNPLKLTAETGNITLRQLANHTAGLPRMPDNYQSEFAHLDGSNYTRNSLQAFLEDYRPQTVPPRPAEYSNLGFALLGTIMEEVYQQSYGELIADKITRPLGLKDTTVELTSEQEPRRAQAHVGERVVTPRGPRGVMQGAGALFSTVADLVQFAEALSSPPSFLQAAWRLAVQPHPHAILWGRYVGLGVHIQERAGEPVYWHNGATRGFMSHFEVKPGARAGTVVLANNYGPAIDRWMMSLSPDRSTPLSSGKPTPRVPLEEATARRLVGVYAVSDRMTLTVVHDQRHQQLRARIHGAVGQGSIFFPIRHIGDHRFLSAMMEFKFEVTGDTAAKAAIVQNGLERWAPRTDLSVPTVIFPSQEELADYSGRFVLRKTTGLTVFTKNHNLFIKFDGSTAYLVSCYASDRFDVEGLKARIDFQRDPDNRVTGFLFTKEGRSFLAVRGSA